MIEVRIDCDDNAYNVIAAVNKLLEVHNIDLKFEFDNNEHDGFDLVHLKDFNEFTNVGTVLESMMETIQNCEKTACQIYWKLSPYGLPGKIGVPTNAPLVMDLAKLSISISYITNILNSVTSILEKCPKQTLEIRNLSYLNPYNL